MQRPAYRSRWLEGKLSGRTSRGKVRLILGARPTGKSSLLRHVAPVDSFFINLQDPRERPRYERAPRRLADELRSLRDRRLTVGIDEIQKVPALLDEVQLLSTKPPDAMSSS